MGGIGNTVRGLGHHHLSEVRELGNARTLARKRRHCASRVVRTIQAEIVLRLMSGTVRQGNDLAVDGWRNAAPACGN